jgi:hypothetical protein
MCRKRRQSIEPKEKRQKNESFLVASCIFAVAGDFRWAYWHVSSNRFDVPNQCEVTGILGSCFDLVSNKLAC